MPERHQNIAFGIIASEAFSGHVVRDDLKRAETTLDAIIGFRRQRHEVALRDAESAMSSAFINTTSGCHRYPGSGRPHCRSWY